MDHVPRRPRHPPVGNGPVPGIGFHGFIAKARSQQGIGFAHGNLQGFPYQTGPVIIMHQGNIGGGKLTKQVLGNGFQPRRDQRLAVVLFAADDFRAALTRFPKAAQLIRRIPHGCFGHNRKTAPDPFFRHIRHMGAIHRDHDKIRAERKAGIRVGNGVHACMTLHKGSFFFRPAEKQGPEQIGIGFGDPAEVFRPIPRTDDDIAKHGSRSFPSPGHGMNHSGVDVLHVRGTGAHHHGLHFVGHAADHLSGGFGAAFFQRFHERAANGNGVGS